MLSPVESGLTFGPYEDDDCYLIEQSEEVKKLTGVKIAEFVLLQGKSLSIVEAKSSIPKPSNEKDYDKFFSEVHDKLLNALTITASGVIGRNLKVSSELPSNIKKIKLGEIKIFLILVIPKAPTAYLPQISDKIRKVMRVPISTWGINYYDIQVLNTDMVIKRSLKT